MNLERFFNHIFNTLLEQQIKLGYEEGAVSLYYPLDTLNALFETECDEKEIIGVIKAFRDFASDRFGVLSLSKVKGRFRFTLPIEASAYVRDNTPEKCFIKDIIEVLSNKETDIKKIIEVFFEYSSKVIVLEASEDEFDTVVYFEDGRPDEFVYLFENEGSYISYHRLVKSEFIKTFPGIINL